MKSITLISCTNAKRDREAPARMLYDESTYFCKMRAWAQSRDDAWYILSAKHGLVHPDEPIAPYDETGLSLNQSETVAETLSDRGVSRVYICAGAAYLAPLEPALEAYDIDVINPFAGLQIGERMAELDSRI